MTATAPDVCRQVVAVTPDLVTDNDAAVGGRLPLLACCPVCSRDGTRHRISWLAPGCYAIDHDHTGRWSVRRVRPVEPDAAPRRPAVDEVGEAIAALAGLLAAEATR